MQFQDRRGLARFAESAEQNVPVPLTAGDGRAIQSAELNQRRVSRILTDPSEGVPALLDAVVRALEINRIQQSDVRDAIGRLFAELDRLATGPVAPVAQDTSKAEERKKKDSNNNNNKFFWQSPLATVGV